MSYAIERRIRKLIRDTIRSQLASYSKPPNPDFSNVEVQLAYQPTQQGVNTQSTIYYYPVSIRRYAFTRTDDSKTANPDIASRLRTQVYRATYSFFALVRPQAPQSPVNLDSYTAEDLLRATGDILQNDKTVKIFLDNGISIERITDISDELFTDESRNFTYAPSFNLTIYYQLTQQGEVSTIADIKSTIYPIEEAE